MATKSNKAVKISKKHLLGIQDLSVSDVDYILSEAKQFISLNRSKNKKLDTLKGKTQINLFFEPSTRTQSSFDLAGLVGADGPTHAGSFDITYLATLPNFIVMAASDEAELVKMINTSVEINDILW